MLSGVQIGIILLLSETITFALLNHVKWEWIEIR
jgi:hypothetical protein